MLDLLLWKLLMLVGMLIFVWFRKLDLVFYWGYLDIYGEHGLLEYIHKELKKKDHMVIVVAEGAGSGVQDLASLKEKVVKD